MGIYAVIDNDYVMNIIVADSKEIAEEVTNKLCVEVTQENGAGIGSIFDGTNFINPKPIQPEVAND